MNIPGIYKIQSLIKPHKFYIGSAVDIRRRWRQHLYLLRKNEHNPIIQNHYNKYGESDFIFIILEPCFPEFLIVREQYYIDAFKPIFNAVQKAQNSFGFKHSKESNRKNRIAHLGKKDSPEVKLKKSLAHKGRPAHNKGVPRTEDEKKRISESMKKYRQSLKEQC